MQKTYLAIDLKSYYASAECAARHLDPLTTNLVVADLSRTEKTICLAVSPSLKAHGISGRARLFEVVQRVREVNAARLRTAVQKGVAAYKDGKPCLGPESFDANALAADPSLTLSYIVAPPRMLYYEKVSRQIYGIYLKYIAPKDICVYSIDEVFIDATGYRSYEEEIADQNRVHELVEKEDVSDEDKDALSNKLIQCKPGTIVTARYFLHDGYYDPLGSYCTITGPVLRVNPVERVLLIKAPVLGPHDKVIPVRISFDDLMELTSNEFVDIEDFLGLERYPDEIP